MKSLFSLSPGRVCLPRWSLRLLAVRNIAISSLSRPGVPKALAGLLGVGVVALIAGMPVPAQAYTAEDLVTVYRVEGEDYSALVRRAEITARASAQQKFDRDILLTRVVITVLGQNGGQTAPILVLDVNRNDWRNRPDPQYWAKYYRSTRVLLELEGFAPLPTVPSAVIPDGLPLNSTLIPSGAPALGQSTPPSTQLLPSGASSPPSINIPATSSGQVGLPRAILRE